MRPTSSLATALLRSTSVCCLFSLMVAVLVGSGAQLVDAKPSSANQLRHRRNLPSGSVPSAGNCTGCIDRRTMAEMRIEQIKKELLEKLGFQRAPQVQPSWGSLPPIGRNNPTVARLLREASQGQAGGRHRDSGYLSEEPYLEEEEEQRPEKTYVFARKSPARFNLPEDVPVGYFEFSASTMAKELKSVDLEVFLRKSSAEFDEGAKVEISIDVYERLRDGKLSDTPIAHKKLHHFLSHERYVRIPLPVDVIRRWFDDELEKAGKDEALGLFVSASVGDENLAEHPQNGDENAMYLELTTVERSSGRSKRDTRDKCSSNNPSNRCCLYDLEIDFEQAGWDFVIAPKRYNAYMCNGECQLGELARFPHTKIATQHAIARGQSGVGPCCHPTEYDAITLIYMTEEREVLISKVTGMIARRCGCA